MFKSGLYLCLILTEAVMMGKEVQSPRERSGDIRTKTSTERGSTVGPPREWVLWVVRRAGVGDEEVAASPAGSAVSQLLGSTGNPKWYRVEVWLGPVCWKDPFSCSLKNRPSRYPLFQPKSPILRDPTWPRGGAGRALLKPGSLTGNF